MQLIKPLILIGLLLYQFNCNSQKYENACQMALKIANEKDDINTNKLYEVMSSGNDTCSLNLVDTIVNLFNRQSAKKYYSILKAIVQKSDGYLSEYLVEKFEVIYHKNFIGFFNLLFIDSQKDDTRRVEEFMIQALSGIAASSHNPGSEVKRIKEASLSEVARLYPNDKLRVTYLEKLLNQIHPKYLD